MQKKNTGPSKNAPITIEAVLGVTIWLLRGLRYEGITAKFIYIDSGALWDKMQTLLLLCHLVLLGDLAMQNLHGLRLHPVQATLLK